MVAEIYTPDPSGRVTQVSGGDMLLPAVCLMCGIAPTEPDQKFIDPHIDKEMMLQQDSGVGYLLDTNLDGGAVYFCLDCAREIGMGTMLLDEVSKLREALNSNFAAEAEIARLTEINERLSDTIEHDVLRYVSDRNSDPSLSPSVASDVPSEPVEDDAQFLYGDFEQPVSDESPAEPEQRDDDSESTESVESDGPADVNESASDNEQRPVYSTSLEL